MTYEQPQGDDAKPTLVTGFELRDGKLTVTIQRPDAAYGAGDYERATKRPPRVTDIPSDYLATLLDWMRVLR